MNLYEINEKIMSCVDMETGEVVDIEALESLQMEFDEKVENIGCWIKDLNAEAKALKEEKDNLYSRQKSCENKAESLKKYLASALEGQKFKTSKVIISYRKSESVDVFDEELVPDSYKEVVATVKVDKTAIKKAIKAGEDVLGAKIVESNNIQIK